MTDGPMYTRKFYCLVCGKEIGFEGAREPKGGQFTGEFMREAAEMHNRETGCPSDNEVNKGPWIEKNHEEQEDKSAHGC